MSSGTGVGTRAGVMVLSLGCCSDKHRVMRHLSHYSKSMSASRQEPDRSRQKARTRAAVVNAAAEMLRRGHQPTVAEAAEAAGVHRATAYRYFPTAASLLADASLTARMPDIDE